MDENKLSYRRIRNDVHIRLNNKEAATFLALMFYSDFNTGESHVVHKTLRDKTGIPESTLKKYLKELAENRGCIQKGNELNYDKAAFLLLDDFRNGRLGNLTIERP